MKGKTLLRAMGRVDERFVAEAEEESPAKVIPMPALRWAAALAACFTLLVVWAVWAQTGKAAPNLAAGGSESNMAAAEDGVRAFGTEGWDAGETAKNAMPETGAETNWSYENGTAETAGAAEAPAAPDSAYSAAGFSPENTEGLRTQSGPETEPWQTYDTGTAQKAAALVGKMLSGEAAEAPEDGETAPITLEFTLLDGTSRVFRLLTDHVPGEAPGDPVTDRAFLQEDSGTWHGADAGQALDLLLLLGYAVE